jgi:TRAP-type C4-dicarboxylate transport system permease large subunit
MIEVWAIGALALCGTATYFLRQRPLALAAFVFLGGAPLLWGSLEGSLLMSTLALCVLLAQPLFVVLGVLTLVCFEFLAEVRPLDYGIFPEKIFELTDKNVLLAIPFFVVSGNIMTRGGIAGALIRFAQALTAWLPGGLAIASIGGCVLFAAISGSSPVTVIAIGSMMYPALVKDGFGSRSAMGLLTSAGSLGIVIPPSIPMIIYAIVVSGQKVVDVGDLFLAGVVPGLLIGSLLAAYVVVKSIRELSEPKPALLRALRGMAVIMSPLVVGELLTLWFLGPWGHLLGPLVLMGIAIFIAWEPFIHGFWALMLPVLILGGIYSGFFTPTEAAAVAVVYSLIAAIYIYRELEWCDVPALVVESTIMMGALVVIMVIAFVFNDYLVEEQIPDQAVELIARLHLSKAAFLIALNIFLLILGCFMDIISAILIVVPLLVPMATAPGIDIDPVHLGIIFIVNLEIGYLTPPLGLNLFVASTLFKKPIGEVARSVLPYTLLMVLGVLVITYVPLISLGAGQWLESLSQNAVETTDDRSTEPMKPDVAPVLSIEELMRVAPKRFPTQVPSTPTTQSKTVLSIEELMQAAEKDGQQNKNETPLVGPKKEGQVLSIEELMKEAENKQPTQDKR